MIDRRRLAMLLGMMGSDHDGEVVNAARAASKLLRDARLTSPEVLEPESVDAARVRLLIAETEHLRAKNDWLIAQIERLKFPAPAARGDIAELLNHRLCCNLNLWEQDFLLSLRDSPRRRSPKQNAALARIQAKVARCRRVA